MNGDKKTIRKKAKKQARTTRATAKATGKTIKKGGKMVARAKKQAMRAVKQSSKQTSKGGTPKKSTRYKSMDAGVKATSGSDMQKNPSKYVSGSAKPKKKVNRKVAASGHGPGKYVNRRGMIVSR